MTLFPEKKTSLLIIDDDEQILRLLRRFLSKHFDSLATAGKLGEAEQYLKNHNVTHLVSDLNLGPNEPNGFDIVTRLRRLYPDIHLAIVFTAEPSPPTPLPPAVDVLVRKNGSLDELFEALGVADS